MAEDVAIEMLLHAAVPPGVGKIFGGTLHQAPAGVGDDQLRPSGRGRPSGSRIADQPDLSSLAPSQMPRIFRKLWELTALATSSETLRTSPAQVRFIMMPSRKDRDARP